MKLSSLLIVGALLVSSAVPALAKDGDSPSGRTRVRNEANILNISAALSNTGLNNQTCGGELTTGFAGSDSYATTNTVNSTRLPSSASRVKVNNQANIANVSVALSNTGMNTLRDHHSEMRTGDATSMSTSDVLNVNVTGF